MADSPHGATIVTAWLCVAAYVISYVLSFLERSTEGRNASSKIWRAGWTTGCLLLAVHVAIAFHFEHDWSHSAAFEHTAEKTLKTTGLDWGGGLYFNWLLLLLWAVDVVLLWTARWSHRRFAQRVHFGTEVYCAFMMFNAAIVFGPVGEWLLSFWTAYTSQPS